MAAATLSRMEIQHRFVEANGVRFHVAECGEGPLVMLLHGFPECWYSWRHQLPALPDAGYRAVAPDMRGYNLSDKPRGGYDIRTLADDAAALGRTLAGPGARAHVIGHDWGGVIAWQTAWQRPDFARTIVAMNAPHPTAFAEYVRRTPSQMLKSTYMLLFQVPRLPEWLLTRDRASAVASGFRRSARRSDAFSDADLEVYRQAILRPGAARCALNYYRQALRRGRKALPSSPLGVPALVLWGEGDPVLQPGWLDGLGAWAPHARIQHIADCGHWTQQEQPDVVNRALIDWLAAHRDIP